jgi:glutamine cyclotransferase
MLLLRTDSAQLAPSLSQYIDGLIYANVWMTTSIAVISPETGLVLKWVSQA